MLSKLKIVIAVAVLSGTVSANVQVAAATSENNHSPSIHNTSETPVKEENEQNIADANQPSAPKVETYYIAKLGDTLWSIANAHLVSVEQLMLWNELDTDIIQPDSKLLIYEDEKNSENTEVPETEDTVATPESEPIKAVEKPAKKAEAKSKPKPKVITVKATAYTAYCKGCSGITKTGINLRKNPKKKVIAVDPRVIPLGTKVHVEGFGTAVAADIGGAIKGKRIDVFIPNKKRAIKFGVKKLKVTIID